MWGSIVHAHLGVVVITVHRFIRRLLELVVDDPRVLTEIWEIILLDDLLKAYQNAVGHAEFVIDVELNNRPMTNNHDFSEHLRRAQADRLREGLENNGAPSTDKTGRPMICIYRDQVIHLTSGKENADQVKDIHDILQSYYKVALKRFVDTACRQVIDHFLLSGAENPLQILTPARISKLSDSQLEHIAGEDVNRKRKRQRLESKIQGLEAAKKVLRT
ncbi:hypothetical protein VTK56DRAFT_5083 [Thermocarpiscus australiensis]